MKSFQVGSLLFNFLGDVDEQHMPTEWLFFTESKPEHLISQINIQVRKSDAVDSLLGSELFSFYPPDSISFGYKVYGFGNYWIATIMYNQNLVAATLQFDLGHNWQLVYNPYYINSALAHPLGTLILLYASMLNGMALLHASAVNYNNMGLAFTGFSGQGKTTISKLFKAQGATLIDDDKVLLVPRGNRIGLYSTPSASYKPFTFSPLNHLFFISHGLQNSIEAIARFESLGRFTAQMLYHPLGPPVFEKRSPLLSLARNTVNFYRLAFVPNASVIGFIETEIQKVTL